MGILRKLAIAGLAFSLTALPATAAFAARHVALVIGNDQYQNLPKLQKAVADAHSYAEVLKAKGFDQVILKNDLGRSQMDEAIAAFLDQIEPGDTAVFAYSGHGWSDGTNNYLVGTDAPVTGSQDFLARISIPLKNGTNGILDEMDKKGAILMVAVIDACRDNPFTPPAGKRSIGLSRGMARIDPPTGTFVVFSAGAGQSALDRLSDSDTDPNSVFTRVFVPALRADMTLQEAIKTTQEQVVALAKSIQENQRPAYYDEVVGRACLSANCNSGAAAASNPPVAPVPAAAPPHPVAAPEQAGAQVRSTYGDWQISCTTPTGTQHEQCVLMQFVNAEDRENVGLTVVIVKTDDKKRVMRILTPLGVLLPSGLGLKIDDTDMGRAGFVRCLPNGCLAEVMLEDKLLARLEGGKTATFIIFQTPDEGIGIPIALNGFGSGVDNLP
jgi:invasion protein IalB